MALVSVILTGLVAVEHVYILVLEMFLWTKPAGRKAFGSTAEFAEQTKVLAANQGLYNGFLAAGLFWGLAHPDPLIAFQIQVFFLTCVVIAGFYGGVSANRRIWVVQMTPALVALTALLTL